MARFELTFRPGVTTQVEIDDDNLLFYARHRKTVEGQYRGEEEQWDGSRRSRSGSAANTADETGCRMAAPLFCVLGGTPGGVPNLTLWSPVAVPTSPTADGGLHPDYTAIPNRRPESEVTCRRG